MIYEKICFSERYPSASLTLFVPDFQKRDKYVASMPAILICPGGGYGNLSNREGEPIALAYLARGFAAFVLSYDVGAGALFPTPLAEAALAIKYIRDNASEFAVDPERVYISGFSAGGHLAASLGTLWNTPLVAESTGVADTSVFRPTGMILGYAVVSGVSSPHSGSFKRINGTEEPTEEQKRRYSAELNVGADTVPAFIWHTFNDNIVPVQNALVMASAMTEAGIPFELHIYPDGCHGLALSNEMTANGLERRIRPEAEGWLEMSVDWMKRTARKV